MNVVTAANLALVASARLGAMFVDVRGLEATRACSHKSKADRHTTHGVQY
jgi:hypothetical protein